MTDTSSGSGFVDRAFGVQHATIDGKLYKTCRVFVQDGFLYVFHGSEHVKEIVDGVRIVSFSAEPDEKLSANEKRKRERTRKSLDKSVVELSDGRVVDLRPGTCFCGHKLKSKNTIALVRSVMASQQSKRDRAAANVAKREKRRAERESRPRVSEAERIKNLKIKRNR